MLNQSRPTTAIINLTAIKTNYQNIQKHLGNKTVIPVVKANAYGHGVIEVVKALIDSGVTFVAVSLLEEAIEIKQVYPDLKVLVMGVVNPSDLDTISTYSITYTISDSVMVEATLNYDKPLTFHVKVDTGMNRLGFKNLHHVNDFLLKVKVKNHLNLEGLYTHFATADSDKDFWLKQASTFKDIVDSLPYHPKMIHASNSSSTIKYEENLPFTTHTRVGIMLYGLSLEDGLAFLKPAMTLKTKVMVVKKLKKGDYVSYNITYQAKENEVIGILPIGYADGFIRKNQGGVVSINNQAYPIIGRVCMDQTIIKIDHSVNQFDDVIMMGDHIVSIDDVAKRLETINYEVVCSVSSRVPRVYIEKEVI